LFAKRAIFAKYSRKSLIKWPERLVQRPVGYNFKVADFALIGSPVSHSLSPLIMGKLGLSYRAREVLPGKLKDFILSEAPSLRGFNITSPLKEEIIPFMARLSPEAKEIRSVNCAVRRGDFWEGNNTDYMGVLVAVDYLGLSPKGALILGTGPAARAAAFAMERMGLRFAFVSRRPGAGRLSRDDLSRDDLSQCDLIINATPPGAIPLPMDLIGPHNFFLDMNYGERANALREALAGTPAGYSDGIPVLLGQAAGSLEVWLGGSFADWRERVFSAAAELMLL
jgi:shikimate 5-dehydrogenase